MTVSQHTLSYITSGGIYQNGNRVSDVFQLRGPDNTAACYLSTCTASWAYDARNRLLQEINGTGTTTVYTLDVYGNITQETQNGTTTRTANYTGLQLTSDWTSGALGNRYYLYDAVGNLNCVLTATAASCPTISGAIDPILVTYNIFDSKNRLIGVRTYSTGSGSTLTSSADYTLDALDRNLSESEYHSNPSDGPTGRTDISYIGLSNAVGQEQLFTSAGTLTETKTYIYDAAGRRVTLTDTPVPGAAARYSYSYDPHGSVELLLDQNNAVKAAYGYTAYGASNLSLTKTATGFTPSTNVYRYAGQRFDTGSNTIDFGARRYSASTQRFIQRDSYFAALDDLGLSSDPINGNRYALTGANPINFVESDGHRNVDGDGYGITWNGNGSSAPPADNPLPPQWTTPLDPPQPGPAPPQPSPAASPSTPSSAPDTRWLAGCPRDCGQPGESGYPYYSFPWEHLYGDITKRGKRSAQ